MLNLFLWREDCYKHLFIKHIEPNLRQTERQIEIKNSSVNKKKVKSNSFQVHLVQVLRYMKGVKLCLAILSLFIVLYHYS